MLDITEDTMTSNISPEYAIRVTRRGAAIWRLSWLPGEVLSHEQAHAGMELDEILSDPAVVYDETAHRCAAALAKRVGIGVDRAVILLAQRLAERLHRTDADEPSGHIDNLEVIPADWITPLRGPTVMGARSRHLWG